MNRPEKKNTTFHHIGSLLDGVFSSLRREKPTDLSLVREAWERIIDPVIARAARPAALKGEILLVHTQSPTVTHQLRFMIPGIIEDLNRELGRPLVREIKCRASGFSG